MLTNIFLMAIGVLLVRYQFWPCMAWILSRRVVFHAIKRYAMKTPYWHLTGYMNRWWIFNPIQTVNMDDGSSKKVPKYPWCPVSARLHHILRADHARDKHSHPGSFRTLIEEGWYVEERDDGKRLRERGDTATLLVDEFHHVSEVSEGGVWTIFIMWDWRGTWGFRLADGTVVPHQDYRNNGQP